MFCANYNLSFSLSQAMKTGNDNELLKVNFGTFILLGRKTSEK